MNESLTERSDGCGSAIYEKYGIAALAGFQAVPDLLLKHQTTLGLSTTDMVVLLNVLMHWWYRDQKPFPRSTTIAKRMGSTARTVQRSLQHLQSCNLLTKEKSDDGVTYLNPESLVARLKELALDDPSYAIRTTRRLYAMQ